MSFSSTMVHEVRVNLKRLDERDLEWLLETGVQQSINPGTIVVQEGQPSQDLQLVLSGFLLVSVSSATGPLEISRSGPGQFLSLVPFINAHPSTTTITASESCTLLSLDYTQLASKLRQDQGFATRFYQTIAVILSEQLRQASSLLVRSRTVAEQPLRKVLFVFAELWDSDIEWMITIGQPERSSVGRVLIQQGEPINALYILLEGKLVVSISAAIDGQTTSKDVAFLATGEMVGEMSFIDAGLPSATVKVAEDSIILGLPCSVLTEKLEQDTGFAARFYRALATILADRLQDRMTSHGYGKRTYTQEQPLDEEIEYEDELDVTQLGNMALAGVRFDWLVRQIRSRC